MSSVSLENITKIYSDGTTGVNDIDIAVEDGEFLVLVGPSGCGKSTTLELIAGLQRPTEGTIRIGDETVNNMKPQKRDIAMVFQSYALYPHKTVKQNMTFGLKYTTNMSQEEMGHKAEEISEMLGISHLLDQKPDQLSGGQQQRVALGRATVRDPDVFLLDEPLSNLDAKLRTRMRAELQHLQNELGVTTIYVTHDQTEAMTMGDRIVIMDDGEVQQIGTPTEVYNEPANEFVAQFIGSPSMNIVNGRLDGSVITTDLFTYELNSEIATNIEGPISLGIRPNDLSIVTDGSEEIIEARVSVVEKLGSENLVHLDLDEDAAMIARVEAEIDPSVDDEVCITFPEERLYLFNQDGAGIKYRNVKSKAEASPLE